MNFEGEQQLINYSKMCGVSNNIDQQHHEVDEHVALLASGNAGAEEEHKKNVEALDQEVQIATNHGKIGGGAAAAGEISLNTHIGANNPPPITPQGQIEDNDSIIAVKDGRVYNNQVSKQSNAAASGYKQQQNPNGRQ